jgi:hypothetical protein
MIRRGKHKTNFVVLPNSMLEDGRLSAASKGTLAYLLSRPPRWEVRHDALRRTMKLGRKAFATVMRNLIAACYARRSKEQRRADDNSFLGYDYDVFDVAERVDEQGTVVPFATAGRRHRKGDNGNKKEEIKDSNTNVSFPLNGAVLAERSQGLPKAETHKGLIAGDRGRFELEIAERLGPDGFALLTALPSAEVDQLCAMQRRGSLEQITLDRVRERAFPLGTQKPE